MSDFLYCLNSSTIRPVPILDKIAIAGETGYSAIELWHDDIDAYLATGGKLADIKKALDDNQLTVPTTIMLKGWFDTTGEEHVAGMDECKRRLHQAVEVGATYSIAGPPLVAADRTVGAKHYAELVELGLSMGVTPAMEYLGFADDINTIEAALEIMHNSGRSEAVIVLDPFHCFRGGGSIETIGTLQASHIAISHFNDAPNDPPRETQHDRDRVMPGDGSIDLKRYLDLLREIGYDRWISLELFREDLWSRNPREVAQIGLEKMQAAVDA